MERSLSEVSKSQHAAPLVSALQRCARRPNAAFYTPGHKRGQGISELHRDLLGQQVFQADLPELPELDNLFAPEGVIREAQELAAAAFGAEQTWFLANGSTCGVEAAILATCGPEDKILMPRNVHRSAISGLILSGAMPVFMTPVYDSAWQLAWGVSADAIAKALRQHPDIRAVLIVSPTYQGICSDVTAIAQVVHHHGIPLIVDEAHGPHFAFHPDLPTPALQAGADLVIQSTHKVLAALTQAAMLHVQGQRIHRHRLHQALQLTQSTSPSYLLLASLDAARHQMANAGAALMAQTLTLTQSARQHLSQLKKLRLLGQNHLPKGFREDPTRLTVGLFDLSTTGFDADDWLHSRWGVTAELPSLNHLTFILSIGTLPQDIEQLCQAMTALAHAPAASPGTAPSWGTELPAGQCSLPQMSPRQAFFATTVPVALTAAVGQISADTLCPYPPGIPTLLPGERIRPEVIEELRTILSAGGIVTGLVADTPATINIVQI